MLLRRLNVGCGGLYREGFINLDRDARVPADVVADAAMLPFDAAAFDAVEMIHVLEHLGPRDAGDALSEAWRALAPGGELVLETPDAEASFRRFLENPAPAARAGLLSWIFGLDAPGWGHRLLFPEALLRHLLEGAGFVDVRREPQRFHLYQPGLRLAARKALSRGAAVIADTRRAVRAGDLADLRSPRVALDFERSFLDVARTLEDAPGAPAPDRGDRGAPARAAAMAIVAAPEAALAWLRCSLERGGNPAGRGRDLARVAEVAVALDLRGRMAALEDDLLQRGTSAPDGHALLMEGGVGVVLEMLDDPGEACGKVLRERLPEAVLPPRGRTPFCREAMVLDVEALHGAGTKAWCAGDLEDADDCFRKAAHLGVASLFPLWSRAVLAGVRGRTDLADACYRKAAGLADEGLASRLEAERTALQKTREGAGPVPRSRPVAWGEGMFHEPV